MVKKQAKEKEEPLLFELLDSSNANSHDANSSGCVDDHPRKPRAYARDILKKATFTTAAVWVGDESFVGKGRLSLQHLLPRRAILGILMVSESTMTTQLGTVGVEVAALIKACAAKVGYFPKILHVDRGTLYNPEVWQQGIADLGIEL